MVSRQILFAFAFAVLSLIMFAAGVYVIAQTELMLGSKNAVGCFFIFGACIYTFVADGHIKASSR